jgi:precorrin isomerase
MIYVPQASAQLPLPEPRTHVDPADLGVAAADPDAPKLTFLEPDTTLRDVRRGYLYVRARCDVRCDLEVVASATISGKQRQIATVTKTLRTNRVTRIRLKIRSQHRRQIEAGARFRFQATPFPEAVT